MAIEKLDPSETALVLIEYQNEFTTEGGALYEAVKPCLDKYDTIANSKKTMDATRMAGCSIIHVPIAFEDGHKEISGDYGILQAIKEGKTFKANEWGSAICDTMKPGPTDLICKGKSGLCGFHSTNLDFLLRQNGIKNVVLGGFLTNCCVESTMRTAYEKGFNVITVTDCCAATSEEGHKAAVGGTFGGAVLDAGFVTTPMPNLNVEGRSGVTSFMDRPVELNYGLNVTGIAFGLGSAHIGGCGANQ